ncbi:MAG: hypothetical protein SOZ68_05550 [Eubacterium pyruvativorans]|uniref:hypothetical protein n=1 Tax=Eubacterium pyruvativorans TaxID=155865 RepID=UPI002A8286E6|nr:hypothetical protein [Eubacterium pyruvativorans]MDY4049801.1 hypothetical protein [Eubacterium pyruvativorans]
MKPMRAAGRVRHEQKFDFRTRFRPVPLKIEGDIIQPGAENQKIDFSHQAFGWKDLEIVIILLKVCASDKICGFSLPLPDMIRYGRNAGSTVGIFFVHPV